MMVHVWQKGISWRNLHYCNKHSKGGGRYRPLLSPGQKPCWAQPHMHYAARQRACSTALMGGHLIFIQLRGAADVRVFHAGNRTRLQRQLQLSR